MDNKQLARRIFDEAWNKGEVRVIDEVIAADSNNHDAYINAFGTGPSGLKNMITSYRKAFPDLRMTVDHQLAEGDYVVTHWTSTATNTGEFMGNPATNKKGTITGMTMHRFRNGKIVETWDNWDVLGMYQQLGLEPKMGKMPTGRTQPESRT